MATITNTETTETVSEEAPGVFVEEPQQKNGTEKKNEMLQQPKKVEQNWRALLFDNVCHYPQESCFTKWSDSLKLDGFKNFIFLLLIIACGRTILENLAAYGFAASPLRWLQYARQYGLNWVALYHLGALSLFLIGSLVLEKCYIAFLNGNQRVSPQPDGTTRFTVSKSNERIFRAFYMSHLVAMLCTPIVLNKLYPWNAYFMSGICLLFAACFLKLYSYHQVNSWWRTSLMYGQARTEMRNAAKVEASMEKYVRETLQAEDADQELLLYPANLTLSNLAYFALTPTLCYQLNYPRTKQRNWRFILRCAVEAMLLLELEIVLVEQWIIVPLESQKFMLIQLTPSQLLLKWTKMSLGTISIWLIGFYQLFQSGTNLQAELLCFADRDFYRDWWNAKTVSEFWRNWNIPVHKWCVRHLYKPLIIQGGYSPTTASWAIFFVSGLFHEYLISVPLGMVCVHFIVGMTLQQPLDMATSNLHKTNARLANSIIWLSLILGQSALILLYYNDIMVRMRVHAAETAASLMI